MTIHEIEQAILSHIPVYWSSKSWEVIRTERGALVMQHYTSASMCTLNPKDYQFCFTEQ